MAMDTQIKGVPAEPEIQVNKVERNHAEPKEQTSATVNTAATMEVTKGPESSGNKNQKGDQKNQTQEKDLTQGSLDSAVSNMNSRMKRTRCEYDFDDPTNTITVKIYDKNTDELIREVPPEKSLEAIKKIWEIAGLIVDEKR